MPLTTWLRVYGRFKLLTCHTPSTGLENMYRRWNEAIHKIYVCLLMFMVSSFIGHKFVEVAVPSKLLPDNNLIGYISHAFISTGSHNVIIMI